MPEATIERTMAAFNRFATAELGRPVTLAMTDYTASLFPWVAVARGLVGAGCVAVTGPQPDWRMAEAISALNAECVRRAIRPMYSNASAAEMQPRFIAALLAGRPDASAPAIDAVEDRFNRVFVLAQAGTRAQALAAFRAAIADAKAGRL